MGLHVYMLACLHGRTMQANLLTCSACDLIDVDGILATCIQHEMDHLEGILFVDHISALKRNMILRKLKKVKKQAAET